MRGESAGPWTLPAVVLEYSDSMVTRTWVRKQAKASALAAVVFGLAGCGGGGSASPAGGFNVTIQWPSTRLIPSLTQTIQVRVADGDTIDEQQDIQRPTGGSNVTSTAFLGLPTNHPLIVECKALGAPVSGTAPILGLAIAPITLQPGTGNAVVLDLASTIDHLTVTGSGISSGALTLGAGLATTLTVTAFSNGHAVVPIGPGDLSFTTAGSGFTASQTGDTLHVTAGSAPASGSIVLTEAESGVTLTIPVTVR